MTTRPDPFSWEGRRERCWSVAHMVNGEPDGRTLEDVAADLDALATDAIARIRELEGLLREARQQERERCAAVCDDVKQAAEDSLDADAYEDAEVTAGVSNGAASCAWRIRALTDDDTKGGADGEA